MTCARCEDLREEVAFLKRELGLERDADAQVRLRRAFRLSGREASILARLLARKGLLPKQTLWQSLYEDGDSEAALKIIDVYVSRLRRALPAGSIDTIWGQGYTLTPVGREACAAALREPAPPPEPVKLPQAPRAVQFVRARNGYLVSLLTRLREGPGFTPDLATALPAGHRHKAVNILVTMAKDGRVDRVAGKSRRGGPTCWVITPVGMAYLNAYAAHTARRAA